MVGCALTSGLSQDPARKHGLYESDPAQTIVNHTCYTNAQDDGVVHDAGYRRLRFEAVALILTAVRNHIRSI